MSNRLPSLKPTEVIRALERAGFFFHHATGSHHYYKHPDKPNVRVSVAVHARELKRGTLVGIIKDAGMTIDEFINLL